MKKVFLTILAVAMAVNFVKAENNGFQVGAGPVFNLFAYNDSKTTSQPDYLSGFLVYASFDHTFNKYLGINAGLRFSEIGLLEHSAVTYGTQANVKSWKKAFIELPVMLVTHVYKGVFVTLGPVAEYGLFFKMLDEQKVNGEVVSSYVTDLYATPKYEDKTVYPRANLGVEAQMGYDFKHVRLFAGFKYDFFNVYKYDDTSCKMMQFQAGAAVRF